MAREVVIETEACLLFDKKMDKPRRAFIRKDWNAFKKFFVEEGCRALTENFDLAKNTAIHVATSSNDPRLLSDLLELLPPADRWRALRKRNANQSTLLHEAVVCTNLEVVNVILKYEKELPTPPDEEIDEPKEKHRPLVELKNDAGETPIYKAAKMGKLKMLKHLRQHVCMADLQKHFDRDDRTPILHAAVINQRFDTAIWLLKENQSLADKKDANELNCLQLLSKMPFVFRSHSPMGTRKMLIYSLLPEQGYLYKKGFQQTRDIETGEVAKPSTSVVSRINDVFWKSLKREIAFWLSRNTSYFNKLAGEKNKASMMTPLQMLSRRPEVFPSKHSPTFLNSLIYCILPDKKNNDNKRERRDIECGRQENAKKSAGIMALMSKMYRAIWDRLAKVCPERKGINKIWHEKNQQNFAVKLAKLLVKEDGTWRDSHNRHEKEANLLAVLPCNVSVAKQQIENRKRLRVKREEREKREQRRENREEIKKPDTYPADLNPAYYHKYTPLLIAASTGIEEIVKEIIKQHPGAIAHVSDDQQNVLHMAVKHRQLNIYKLIKDKSKESEFESLVVRINDAGRSVLHQAAFMDYYREGRVPGVAYQLQEQLRWFDRMKRKLPERYLMHCDDEDTLTAGDVLDMEHEPMLQDARRWIKETAQSCSTVAVLVATVVFAAAYTTPGGTADNGLPKFLHSPVFVFFTIMDVVALASSLGAVVMFLSILSSPFEMWDFHVKLPRKLGIGFFLLFVSLTATMLAFGATISLIVKLEKNKWTSTLTYGAAFFPLAIFGFLQFPSYKNSVVLRYLGKLLKKVLVRVFRKKIN